MALPWLPAQLRLAGVPARACRGKALCEDDPRPHGPLGPLRPRAPGQGRAAATGGEPVARRRPAVPWQSCRMPRDLALPGLQQLEGRTRSRLRDAPAARRPLPSGARRARAAPVAHRGAAAAGAAAGNACAGRAVAPAPPPAAPPRAGRAGRRCGRRVPSPGGGGAGAAGGGHVHKSVDVMSGDIAFRYLPWARPFRPRVPCRGEGPRGTDEMPRGRLPMR
mmetsp:Transcript_85916/g.256226  ORF Transcript_85916/g.256226 Transcript_85916/m.256226 type:complete len:221 (+) Transcript_85916:1297-1959(+)